MKSCSLWLAVAVSLSASPLLPAQVLIFDTYDSFGTGTYEDAWGFAHAETSLGTRQILNIDDSSGRFGVSPAGGNYLTYSTDIATWAGDVYARFPGGEPEYRVFTTSPFVSTMGHFYREEMLEAGRSYTVSLWRNILIESSASVSALFSVWSSSGLDLATPFLSTPGNQLGGQSYDFTTGGWQEVDVTFTAPGTVGSGTVPITFMMGVYEPSTIDVEGFMGSPEFDGDIGTADFANPDDGWMPAFSNGTAWQQQHLAIDQFSVTMNPIPEPSTSIALASGIILGCFRRRRKSEGC